MSGYCDFAPGHPLHGPYHDHEYGFPQAEERVLGVEPGGETAMAAAQAQDHAGIVDRGIDLEPVADDARVGEQARAISFAIRGDTLDVEAVVGAVEARALLQHRLPAQPGLVDFQQQALEQHGFVAVRETVFVVVVIAMHGVPRGDVAVARHGSSAGCRIRCSMPSARVAR